MADNWLISHRKDAHFSSSEVNTGTTLEFFALRKGGGYFAPLVFESNGDILLASPKQATSGKIGVGLLDPEAKLDVFQSGSIDGIWNPTEASLQLTDGTASLIFDSNEIYSNSSLAIGSSDAEDILFRNVSTTGSTDLMVVKANGDVEIGTSSPNAKLAVNGMVTAKEVEVQANGWPDYVFEVNYKLPSLSEVEAHIKENSHLPGIPSAKDVEENGVNLGKMDALLLQKIEELTLYIIQQNKEYNQLKEKNRILEERVEELSTRK